MTFLDSRSKITDEEERRRRFSKKDPRRELMTYMSAELHACDFKGCHNTIEPGDPIGVPKSDPKATWCWHCTSRRFLPELADYAEERRQCERERRLEAALLAEQAGDLSPAHWFTIAEANMGYREPGPELVAYVGELCADYMDRFHEKEIVDLEAVRARLWSFAPSGYRGAPGLGGLRLELEPEGPTKVTTSDGGEPGLARFQIDFLARVVIR